MSTSCRREVFTGVLTVTFGLERMLAAWCGRLACVPPFKLGGSCEQLLMYTGCLRSYSYSSFLAVATDVLCGQRSAYCTANQSFRGPRPSLDLFRPDNLMFQGPVLNLSVAHSSVHCLMSKHCMKQHTWGQPHVPDHSSSSVGSCLRNTCVSCGITTNLQTVTVPQPEHMIVLPLAADPVLPSGQCLIRSTVATTSYFLLLPAEEGGIYSRSMCHRTTHTTLPK